MFVSDASVKNWQVNQWAGWYCYLPNFTAYGQQKNDFLQRVVPALPSDGIPRGAMGTIKLDPGHTFQLTKNPRDYHLVMITDEAQWIINPDYLRYPSDPLQPVLTADATTGNPTFDPNRYLFPSLNPIGSENRTRGCVLMATRGTGDIDSTVIAAAYAKTSTANWVVWGPITFVDGIYLDGVNTTSHVPSLALSSSASAIYGLAITHVDQTDPQAPQVTLKDTTLANYVPNPPGADALADTTDNTRNLKPGSPLVLLENGIAFNFSYKYNIVNGNKVKDKNIVILDRPFPPIPDIRPKGYQVVTVLEVWANNTAHTLTVQPNSPVIAWTSARTNSK
jgi:hypothetical protein